MWQKLTTNATYCCKTYLKILATFFGTQNESVRIYQNLAVALSYVQGKLNHAIKDSNKRFFKSTVCRFRVSMERMSRFTISAWDCNYADPTGMYCEVDKSVSLTTIIAHKNR